MNPTGPPLPPPAGPWPDLAQVRAYVWRVYDGLNGKGDLPPGWSQDSAADLLALGLVLDVFVRRGAEDEEGTPGSTSGEED